MRVEDAWAELGIEPTKERREVKRAYARKLKQIDPDRDVAGFLSLRDALAIAQSDAEWRSSPHYDPNANDDDYWDDEDWDEEYRDDEDKSSDSFQGDLSSNIAEQLEAGNDEEYLVNSILADLDVEGEADFNSSLSEDMAQHWQEDDAQPDPFREKFQLLASMLNEAENPWPDPEATSNILHELLADERMEHIDFASDFEEAVSWLLFDNRPRSNALLGIAAKYFDWENRSDLVNDYSVSGELSEIASAVRAEQELNDPAHEWHKAWLRLNQGEVGDISWKDWLQLGKPMRQLISSLYEHHPTLIDQLDRQYLVQWWEKVAVHEDSDTDGDLTISWWGILIIALTVIYVIARVVGYGG